MNKAQRTVLFTAVLAILAMCAVPPCKGTNNIEYVSIWHMYWFYARDVLMSFLIGQVAIVTTIATLLTLAFKSAPK